MEKTTKFEVKTTTAARNVELESAVSRNVNVMVNDKKLDRTSCSQIKRVCGC